MWAWASFRLASACSWRAAAVASRLAAFSAASDFAAFSDASSASAWMSRDARRARSRAELTASVSRSPVVDALAATISPARRACSTILRDCSSFSSMRVTAKISSSLRLAASTDIVSSDATFSVRLALAEFRVSRRISRAWSAWAISDAAARAESRICAAWRGIASPIISVCLRISDASVSSALRSSPRRPERSFALSAVTYETLSRRCLSSEISPAMAFMAESACAMDRSTSAADFFM